MEIDGRDLWQGLTAVGGKRTGNFVPFRVEARTYGPNAPKASIYEVVTLNEVFKRKKNFKEEDAQNVRNRCVQIDKKLIGLINRALGEFFP